LDDVGNRLTRTSTLPGVENQTLSYDANDRLTTDTYDPNGNTVVGHIQQSAPAVSDTYDFEDRLISRNNGQVTITYDGDGNRVTKTVAMQSA
jgi:YD repeat-containing protein